MKIKIAYGVDMRLWKHSPIKDKPESQTYQDLLTYIIKTFEFKEITDFLIKFKDDDDELTTISSLQDFQDAYISYKQQEKKSLKLHISDVIKPSIKSTEDEKDEEEEKKSIDSDPIKSKQNDDQPPIQSKYAAPNDNDSAKHPSEEEINAFLSDDFVIDLLSDLFIKVFEALEESSFDVSFIECIQGIILSDDGKYDKLTSNTVWPYFMKEILPKHSPKIEMFVIPMIRNNGNSQMIKQMVPTMLNMMKMHHANKANADNNNNNNSQFNPFGGQFPFGRGRRGGRGWRGRGWRHGHHHGHHHNHHRHHHHGRGGFRGYGHGHPGHNPWFQQSQENQPSAPPMEGQNDENEQIEQEQFEYTEELVAIMNMGFTNMNKIKELLNQHKGNKQRVVQELVSAKN